MKTSDSGFWQQLPQPFVGLSPMDGITDAAFRQIQKKYGQPDLIYSEFVSVEGLCHGADALLKDLIFDESERPIVAQVYGTTPDFFRQAAVLISARGFDGIDINMGCPAKNVAHAGAGAALITTPKLAQAIIKATKQGVKDWSNGMNPSDCENLSAKMKEVKAKSETDRLPIPVSVKTRIGYKAAEIESWLPYLLAARPAAIAIHGRTLKQQYGGHANWQEIGRAAALAKETETLIIGNGDLQNRDQAHEYCTKFATDGALIGRAALGNPYVFEDKSFAPQNSLFEIALEHAQLYETLFGNLPKYNFLPMRKHLGWYVKSVPNASQIRQQLFATNNASEVKTILSQHGLV